MESPTAKDVLLKYYNSTNESIPYSSTATIWKTAALAAMKEHTEQKIKHLIDIIDEKVKERREGCLTDQFTNGEFWAYKDIQTLLYKQLKDGTTNK